MLTACQEKTAPPLGASVAGMAPSPSMQAASTGGPPTYVGAWATSVGACGTKAWTFTAAKMTAPGLSCTLERATPTPAGYVVDGVCFQGDARPAPTRLMLTLTGHDGVRSVTISGGAFPKPVALTRCDGVTEASAGPRADDRAG